MKKYQIKYSRLMLIVGLLFSLQSCLKNNSYYTDFSKSKPAVELPLAANNANAPLAVSFDIKDAPTPYFVVVNVASAAKPDKPVSVTIAVDVAGLTQYNAEQDAIAKKAQADYLAADPDNTVNDSGYPDDYTPFELMPDSTYTVPSFTATIPAGQRQVQIPVQIITSKLDATHNYILPFTISQSSIAISNWNRLLLNIGPKNEWDGIYKVAGEFYHPAYGDQKWDFSAGITQTLITTGPKSIVFGPNIKTPLVQFGIAMSIIINSDNSLVEVLNGTTTATPNDDHYDPATKTFYVHGGYGTRKYSATLTYVKPR